MQKLIQCKFLTGTVCPQQDLDFAMSFCQMCCRSLTVSGLQNIFLCSKSFASFFNDYMLVSTCFWQQACKHRCHLCWSYGQVATWTCNAGTLGSDLAFLRCACFSTTFNSNAASCWNQRWNYRQVRQIPRSWVSSLRCIWQEVSRFRPTRGWRCKGLHSHC